NPSRVLHDCRPVWRHVCPILGQQRAPATCDAAGLRPGPGRILAQTMQRSVVNIGRQRSERRRRKRSTTARVFGALLSAPILAAGFAVGGLSVPVLAAEIKIGAPLALTGSLADEAKKQDVVWKMWLEKVNAAGGIDVGGTKYKVQLVQYDYQSDG